MAKTKITIEYPLATRSAALVWQLISEAHGLEKWMADHVEERAGGEMVFTWGEPWTEQDVKTSRLLSREPLKYVRLRWDDNESDADYWELRIEKSPFSGNLCLVITDHVDDDDADYMRGVWSHDLDKLHMATGF